MATETVTKNEFSAFQKEYAKVIKQIARAREDAVGILDPSLLTQSFLDEMKRAGQKLVLAYGKNGNIQEYSPADLRRFLAAKKKTKTKFNDGIQGVPLDALERTSSRVDVLRSKDVRNATLYRIEGNLLSFRVTATGTTEGVSHHMVKMRLEDWTSKMTSPAGFLVGARVAATGRISFDCTCGRHQYWFRYLATIGDFALEPEETGFPKIRNPHLTGCCCKHVLKTLKTLRGGALHLILAKEMERQAKAKGFTPKKARLLSKAELQAASTAVATQKDYRDVRMARKTEAMLQAALEHEEEATRLRKAMKPRKKSLLPKKTKPVQSGKAKSEISKEADFRKLLVGSIKSTLMLAKMKNVSPSGIFDSLAKDMGIPREHIDRIIKEENLS